MDNQMMNNIPVAPDTTVYQNNMQVGIPEVPVTELPVNIMPQVDIAQEVQEPVMQPASLDAISNEVVTEEVAIPVVTEIPVTEEPVAIPVSEEPVVDTTPVEEVPVVFEAPVVEEPAAIPVSVEPAVEVKQENSPSGLFKAPDGTVWGSEADYKHFYRIEENVVVNSEEPTIENTVVPETPVVEESVEEEKQESTPSGLFKAPDGTVWGSEADYKHFNHIED